MSGSGAQEADRTATRTIEPLDFPHAAGNSVLMQITLTLPIEAFIERQISQGYKDSAEVARQALLRWMAEESDAPPHIQARLDEAANGRFTPGDRSNIERIIATV
jgi:Arc/MetJ-type ribon-helix-helix transcriptional regulator